MLSPYRSFRLRLFAGGGARPAVQAPKMSFVALVIAVAVWRFAWLTAWPRIEPAAALNPLSHMLMNGFFFSHGLAISNLLQWKHRWFEGTRSAEGCMTGHGFNGVME